jgi:uncharacterized membrane protein YfcA
MDPSLAFLLLTLGLITGFFSGLLGIGGGILMAPLLLYVPPLFRLGLIDMKTVAALTMAQGFFASLSAVLLHKRYHHVCTRLVLTMGSAALVGSFTGAVFSAYVSDRLLLAVFSVLALIAAGIMFFPIDDQEAAQSESFSFPFYTAFSIPLVLGFFLGLVGQGGAFIWIPIMLYIIKVPTRLALGSSLGIVLLSASAGLMGKIMTGQVFWNLAVFLVIGALIGGQLGAYQSQRTKPVFLRHCLAVIIVLSAIRISYELLVGG